MRIKIRLGSESCQSNSGREKPIQTRMGTRMTKLATEEKKDILRDVFDISRFTCEEVDFLFPKIESMMAELRLGCLQEAAEFLHPYLDISPDRWQFTDYSPLDDVEERPYTGSYRQLLEQIAERGEEFIHRSEALRYVHTLYYQPYKFEEAQEPRAFGVLFYVMGRLWSFRLDVDEYGAYLQFPKLKMVSFDDDWEGRVLVLIRPRKTG